MTKNEFYSVWLSHFAKDVSRENIEKYVVSTGNFLWHVFSWKLLDEKTFLTGNSARKAYDKIDKRNALYIEWFEEDETKELTAKFNTSIALEKTTEIYVVAPDFSWTYIKTHESMCGPYFMRI
ncbi:MAG: DUF4275 family protein [Clostridia bacterium]|nr:DUF4275 family protein [Clostridia bacterium]